MKVASKIKDFIFEFGIIGSMTGFIAVMPGVGTTLLLTTMYSASPWLQANQQLGILIFVLAMTFLCGLALLAINFVGVVSGFAFGFQMGLMAHLAGIVGASTLMFILANRFASGSLQTAIDNKPKLQVIQKALLEESILQTLLILILVRLSPAFPFAATNFLISASGISYKVYILGTMIGLLPRAAGLVFVGSSLSELKANSSQETWIIYIVGIIATILAIFLISGISKRALLKITNRDANSEPYMTSNQFQPND